MSAVIYENNPNGDNIVIIPGEGSGVTFEGLTPVTLVQGADFDPTDGVKAFDKDGNEIPFTVSPNEIDACAVGNQTLTYTADDKSQTRTITITQAESPTITGVNTIEVQVGEEFDPLQGVSAEDANGNPLTVVVEHPVDNPYIFGEIGQTSFTVEPYSLSQHIAVDMVEHMPPLEIGDEVVIMFTNLMVEGSESGVIYNEDAATEPKYIHSVDEITLNLLNAPDIVYASPNAGYANYDNVFILNDEGEESWTISWDKAELWVTGEAE